MDKKQIIVSEGSRSLWQTIVASFFFTLAFVLFAMFFYGYEFLPTDNISFKWDISNLWLGVACISQGVIFSLVKSIYFDLKNRLYKEQYKIGPLKFGRWKGLPKIDYVSVFRQPKTDGNFVFEVNLWYQKNKHFNIYENMFSEPVFEMGLSVANILGVRLLDSTEPNNYKWIDVDESISR